MSDDDTTDDGKKKGRSPNFPMLTFSEALAYARKIYEKDRTNTVSNDLAAQHIGFSGETGASLGALAALKRYGLLEVVGGDVRISNDAKVICVHPSNTDDEEVDAIVRRLAMLPPLFTKVLDAFDELPSNDNLRAKLQSNWSFASAKAADTFIRALREAVSIRDGGLARTVPRVENSPENPMHSTDNQQIRVQIPAVRAGTQARPWDLGGGAIVTVVIPDKLTKKNIEKFKKYIAALEVEASISWDEDGES